MNNSWPWWILAALALGGGAVVIAEKTRGLRNKNPGNIRHSAERWTGEITGTDPAFKTFAEHKYGLRALAKLLLNYQRIYQLDTVAGIVNRWAPASENNTGSYINAVAKALGVTPTQKINVRERLPQLMAAIIKHENGINPYTAEQINEGIALV